MSIICVARNCPIDSPEACRRNGRGMYGAGIFVTIACHGSPQHGNSYSHHAHLTCAARIAPSLLGVEAWENESSWTEVDDDRRIVSHRDIEGLFYCGDINCLTGVLSEKGTADVKAVLKLAQQNLAEARQALGHMSLDYEARGQLEEIIALRDRPSPLPTKPSSSPTRAVVRDGRPTLARATLIGALIGVAVAWSISWLGSQLGISFGLISLCVSGSVMGAIIGHKGRLKILGGFFTGVLLAILAGAIMGFFFGTRFLLIHMIGGWLWGAVVGAILGALGRRK